MATETRNPSSWQSRVVNAALLVGFGVMAGLALSDWWPAQASGLVQVAACDQVVAQRQ
jgi:hypothetical protein